MSLAHDPLLCLYMEKNIQSKTIKASMGFGQIDVMRNLALVFQEMLPKTIKVRCKQDK